MTQPGLGLDLSTKRTRKREFLAEMRRVVPWLELIALIEPHYPTGETGGDGKMSRKGVREQYWRGHERRVV